LNLTAGAVSAIYQLGGTFLFRQVGYVHSAVYILKGVMRELAIKYWYFGGIGVAVLLGLLFPDFSGVIKEYKLLKIGIFVSFFLTSLKLDTSHIVEQSRNFKGVFIAMLSCFVFFPLIARVFAALVFPGDKEILVGICIFSVVPVTMATGMILTSLAGGNVPFSLMINITSNFLSILTIPFSLQLLLATDKGIDLPVARLMGEIALLVLVPVVLGQILRIGNKDKIAKTGKAFSIFCQFIVLMIIYNGVASSTNEMANLGMKIIYIAGAMILLHIIIIVMNYQICKLLKLDTGLTYAFTLQTSQKTLGLSYILWEGYFASFLLAIIPPICYHLTQSIGDTYLAHYFFRRGSKKDN
jgi:sodium/bile acid cotransporter 7